MHYILQNVAYKLTSKRIDDSKLEVLHINLNKKDLCYFNLSSNSIISFFYNGKYYYFRECPKRMPFASFFDNSIEKFFETLGQLKINKEHFGQEAPINIDFSKKIIENFKAYIDDIKVTNQFQKFMSKTDILSKKYGFSIWNKDNVYDSMFFEKFGLPNLPSMLKDIAVYFLWYMRSVAMSYRVLKIAYSKNYSFFGAVRSISSRILAEELGLDNMISKVQWCMLELENNEKIFGTISEAALGNRMLDCNIEATGSLQRELINLNLLDVISFQLDHGPNNYNIYVNENREYSICAFDNDNPYTFFPSFRILNSFSECTPIIDKKGIITRPYFDKYVASKINDLNFKSLREKLRPYLNEIQIMVLGIRIKKIKKAIIKTQKMNPHFLIEKSDWSAQTVQEETNGKYGMTYLVKAMWNKE